MKRPEHLPDFSDPPLDEMVLGVQFTPVPKYASVHAMKVWELFKPEFPRVDEQPVIDTQFETFGGSNIETGPRIHVGTAPVGSRLWFISHDENQVLQFQSDRLVMNWRRQPTPQACPQAYPRFESVSKDFKKNLGILAEHFISDFDYQIDINQAEVSYINIIPVDDFSQAEDWLNLWSTNHLKIEGLNISFSEVITDGSDKPRARLRHDIQSVFTVDGQNKALRLSLTYKGKPEINDINSAMEFLFRGRDAIVTRFGEITTQKAHQKWGEIK